MSIDPGYEASSIELVEDVLDSLSPATSVEVYLATRDVSERAIAAVAAARADSTASALVGNIVGNPNAGGGAPMFGAQGAWGNRVRIPATGTLRDFAIWVKTSVGNVDVGIYSVESEPRARLWSSGSVACPAANSWGIVGDPQLEVEAGDEYDFILAASSGSAEFGSGVSAGVILPAGFLAGGVTPRQVLITSTDLFPLPATIADSVWFSDGSISSLGAIARLEA